MKKEIVFLFAFLVMSIQTMGQAQFALGLKGGMNFSKFDVNAGADNIKNRTGFHAGAFALVKITAFGIQPEVLFSRQGSTFKANTTNYEANFDYINVPIMLKFYLPLGLNIQAGPQFGFLTIAELTNTANGVKDPKDAKTLFNNKKSDMAIAFGAGWDLPFGITVDARYNFGLSDVKITPSGPGQSPVTFKNKVIQISVGYKLIKLGK